jgi:hypothetical protein
MSPSGRIEFHGRQHNTSPKEFTIMKRPTSRSIAAIAVSVVAVSALAACGSDDDSKSDAVAAAACDAAIDYGVAFSQAPQDPAEFATYAQERLVPIGDTLVANLTGDSKTAAVTLRDTFATIAETGDPSALESPEASAATGTVGQAIHNGCGMQAVDIKAIEYSYVDAPSTLKAGAVSFSLKNEGVEEHEMVLFKRADGVTETLDQILELPEDEQMSKIAFTGVTFGAPDTTNYVAVDLEPGTYFLLCFIPQGGAEDGPPHFLGGMKQTIEVA